MINIRQITKGAFLLLLSVNTSAFSAGIVAPGTLEIGDYGTAATPANWTLNGDYTAESDFTIGHSNGLSSGNYNVLTVSNGQTFSAQEGFIVGPVGSGYNQLNIETGAYVNVAGDMRLGTGSISYYSPHNMVNVDGSLTVGGDFNIGSRTAHSGILSINPGAIVKVSGDFNLYSHWVYSNSWLELNGGTLALEGDKTTQFVSGNAILASIKVWSDNSGQFEAVADYTGSISSSTLDNAYSNLLSVEYITDNNNDLFGYTVVTAVPEPATILLLAFGSLAMIRSKK